LRRIRWIILPAWLLAIEAWALPGVMLRNDDLRASYSASAARLSTLAKGRVVEIVASRGGWTQVRAGSALGWVRLLSVRRGSASQADLQAGLGSARDAINTPVDRGAVTATSGLRGLDVADLGAARFDAAELARLDGQGVTPAQASEFAQRGGLVARTLADLPDPAQGISLFGATRGE